MIDLATIHDHPIQVLLRTPGIPVGTYTAAVRRLSDYEAEHKVTFTALDNDTLANLREAYEASMVALPNTGDHRAVDVDVLRAVADLLGLEES